jgi:signal transduction histidine kinase
LVVLVIANVTLPALSETPLRWGLLPLLVIAMVTVTFTWQVRLVVVPLLVAASSLSFSLGGSSGAEVAVLAGMMLVAWLLLSMLRAVVQRGIRATVRERRSVERTRDLLATMAELVSLDPTQTVASVADALVVLGYPLVNVGEVVGGRIINLETRGVPESVEVANLPITEGIAGGSVREQRPIYVDDYGTSPYRTDNAPPIPIGAAMAMPIVLDGESVGSIIAGRPEVSRIDDQDRRYFEALGRHAARALDVARRYRSEQQVAERLAEFERLKLGFLGSVTADLRGPLTVIRGLSHTLHQHSQVMDQDDAEHLLGRINDAVDRLDRMIESLLDFSRTRRSPTEAYVGVPLDELAERSVVAAQSAYVTHHIALTAEGSCLVDGDPALLGQAMTHLIDNACRHTPEGSHVTVRAEERAGVVIFRVADDGPGLPAVVAEAIRIGAIGDLHGTLGFTLVSHILAAHQARLEVVSTDVGTIIGFSLAASQSGLGSPRAAADAEHAG